MIKNALIIKMPKLVYNIKPPNQQGCKSQNFSSFLYLSNSIKQKLNEITKALNAQIVVANKSTSIPQ